MGRLLSPARPDFDRLGDALDDGLRARRAALDIDIDGQPAVERTFDGQAAAKDTPPEMGQMPTATVTLGSENLFPEAQHLVLHPAGQRPVISTISACFGLPQYWQPSRSTSS